MLFDSFLRKGEEIELNDSDLKQICNNKVNIIPYSTLVNYKDIFQFLGEFKASLIFYETTSMFEGHWTAIVYNEVARKISFYDSYGNSDEEILKMAKTSDILVNDTPVLTNLITNACKKYSLKFERNTERMQDFGKSIRTCGRYSACFIRFRHLGVQSFNALLKYNKYPPDDIITALTILFSEDAELYAIYPINKKYKNYIDIK